MLDIIVVYDFSMSGILRCLCNNLLQSEKSHTEYDRIIPRFDHNQSGTYQRRDTRRFRNNCEIVEETNSSSKNCIRVKSESSIDFFVLCMIAKIQSRSR